MTCGTCGRVDSEDPDVVRCHAWGERRERIRSYPACAFWTEKTPEGKELPERAEK